MLSSWSWRLWFSEIRKRFLRLRHPKTKNTPPFPPLSHHMNNDLEANLLGEGGSGTKRNKSQQQQHGTSNTDAGGVRGETPPVYNPLSMMPRNFSITSLGASPMLPPLQELGTFFDAKPLTKRTSSIQRPKLDHSLEIEVEVRDLDFCVDKGRKKILHGINVKFFPGKITALMGPSGSGE